VPTRNDVVACHKAFADFSDALTATSRSLKANFFKPPASDPSAAEPAPGTWCFTARSDPVNEDALMISKLSPSSHEANYDITRGGVEVALGSEHESS
jgi:hypothetical protein